MNKTSKILSDGKINDIDQESCEFLSRNGILSVKPKIIVCNVDEGSLVSGNEYTKK